MLLHREFFFFVGVYYDVINLLNFTVHHQPRVVSVKAINTCFDNFAAHQHKLRFFFF